MLVRLRVWVRMCQAIEGLHSGAGGPWAATRLLAHGSRGWSEKWERRREHGLRSWRRLPCDSCRPRRMPTVGDAEANGGRCGFTRRRRGGCCIRCTAPYRWRRSSLPSHIWHMHVTIRPLRRRLARSPPCLAAEGLPFMRLGPPADTAAHLCACRLSRQAPPPPPFPGCGLPTLCPSDRSRVMRRAIGRRRGRYPSAPIVRSHVWNPWLSGLERDSERQRETARDRERELFRSSQDAQTTSPHHAHARDGRCVEIHWTAPFRGRYLASTSQ